MQSSRPLIHPRFSYAHASLLAVSLLLGACSDSKPKSASRSGTGETAEAPVAIELLNVLRGVEPGCRVAVEVTLARLYPDA